MGCVEKDIFWVEQEARVLEVVLEKHSEQERVAPGHVSKSWLKSYHPELLL